MLIPTNMDVIRRKKALACDCGGVHRGAELALELALPFCDARSLAAVGAISRAFRDLIFAPSSSSEDLWAGSLQFSTGWELASGAGRVLAQLGGASYLSLAASSSTPAPLRPLSFHQIENDGKTPLLTLNLETNVARKDDDLRSICVAAVEWLQWGSAGQLLWCGGADCRLLCTRSSSVPATRRSRHSLLDDYRVTGKAEHRIGCLDTVVNILMENIYADCWSLKIDHPICPEIAARWSNLNFDCLAGGDDDDSRAQASREALCRTEESCSEGVEGEEGRILRQILADGCSIALTMAASGEVGEGVRYEYSYDNNGFSEDGYCWTERAEFNYRTNAHGLLATLWQETKNCEGEQRQDETPFVAPSKWEGWPWSLLAK